MNFNDIKTCEIGESHELPDQADMVVHLFCHYIEHDSDLLGVTLDEVAYALRGSDHQSPFIMLRGHRLFAGNVTMLLELARQARIGWHDQIFRSILSE